MPVMSAPANAASQKSISRQEDKLAAAGFIVRPANTPARIDMLSRLPAGKFVRRVNGDDVTYVYADPKSCNCLYVGTQAAYAQYQAVMQAKNLVDEQNLTAGEYSDGAWDWGSWGSWGPRWGFHRRGW